ncbi:MAG: ATP-dependent helicase [Spirochaetaceae bacterium]|jgi:DNA helicase-2/ATP-dependent DNA helicase PcrA|nr:ATP-dependent helicase [Spirochaetaceae bacterium]
MTGGVGIPPYLETLNPEQRQAVLHEGRSLLILAGAGSGKTRVITTKIAYLVRDRGMDPRSILAVTFTNKAAREMAERARLIDDRAGEAMLRTFHSFGAWFLRRNGSQGGLDPGFVIYDDDDSTALLGTVMENTSKAVVKETAHSIARAKDYFLSPQDPELDLISYRKDFRDIYARYEERLRQIGNVDFGDLIKKPVEILRAVPEVARRFHDRFRVILVDEYQDSNIAQFELLKELTGPETSVCVVGDDDQSIYRFRGAEVKNILEFPDRFSGTDIIRLERNYRSTVPILKVASSVVDNNRDRLGKTLRAERGAGKTPVLAFLPDQDEEVVFCANLIERSRGKEPEAAYSDWAILYRTNAQSLGFETEFLRRRIPYRVVGTLKFYEREEIKDALALLSFLVNPRDEVAFRRVVNKPSRGVGAATVDRILGEAFLGSPIGAFRPLDRGAGAEAAPSFARRLMSKEEAACSQETALQGQETHWWGGDEAGIADGDLAAAAQRLLSSLPAKAQSGITAFLAVMEKVRSTLAETAEKKGEKQAGKAKHEGLRAGEGLSLCVVQLVMDAGIAEYHNSHDEVSGNQRLNNLQELANAASLYPATMEGLLEFLEHIELDRSLEEERKEDKDKPHDTVTLITYHNTKGLEFRRVIMTGLEQGVFPRDDKEWEDLEEERRLFYVGATRAMDELYLSSCAVRRMYGRTAPMEPSLFLREIDQSSLRVIGTVPYGFAKNPAAKKAPSPRAKGVLSSDGRWQVGCRLFHDDYGYGGVTEIRETEEGPVILARFDTGKELRFLSLYQSSRITKIEEE